MRYNRSLNEQNNKDKKCIPKRNKVVLVVDSECLWRVLRRSFKSYDKDSGECVGGTKRCCEGMRVLRCVPKQIEWE
ncbi:hypothetical protein HanPI659440_Chr01g0026241 [Helianthus annuus]|nr:hypothetical protein HanPI659440_Chr01g0026241 [Helianthus annuus]